MIDMCRKFHTNNLACLVGCYDQLCQILRTGQAELIKIRVVCRDLKRYHLLFLEVMSLYYCEAGMRIEKCREDCYDLYSTSSCRTTSSKLFEMKDKFDTGL